MSKETLDVVRESWWRSRRNGVALGEIFRLNLRRINPTLLPIESKTTKHLLDLLLVQAIDEVINRLDDKQELVHAMRNFCYLFKLSNDRKNEVEHISKAILETIEKTMDNYFSLQLSEGRNLMRKKFTDIESIEENKHCS